jgi:hypothetical protein
VSEIRNVELLRLGFESFTREGPGGLGALLAPADTEQALSAAASLARES